METFNTENEALSRCNEYYEYYKDLGYNYKDKIIAQHYSEEGDYDFWGLVIYSEITTEWAKRASAERQGLLINIGCYDGVYAHSYANTRATLAYEIAPFLYHLEVPEILRRMTGVQLDGKYRTSLAAVRKESVYEVNENDNIVQYGRQISHYGKPVELCPVINKVNAMSHTGMNNRKDVIKVNFSSEIQGDPSVFIVKMHDDNVMQWTKCKECGKSKPHWHGNDHTNAYINYEIKGDAGLYYIYILGTVTKAKTKQGSLYLDANKMAPNMDNYIIELNVKTCGP